MHDTYVRCISKYSCSYNVNHTLWSSSYAFWPHYYNKGGYNNGYLYTLSMDMMVE